MKIFKPDRGLTLAIILAIFGVISIFFPYSILDGYTLFGFVLSIKDYDKLGGFVGGITTPFLSISAFILLFLTYHSQKSELSENRKILKKQNFEQTFFNTLSLLNNIINSISISQNDQSFVISSRPKNNFEHHGRECFKEIYTEFKEIYDKKSSGWCLSNLQQAKGEFIKIPPVEDYELIISSYSEIFEKHQTELGHYFRTLYNIIKLVNDNNPENAKYYTNLVRAQLSTYEHLLLFYNCISGYGKDFKPYVIDYSLLDGYPETLLLSKSHEDFYPEKARS